MLKNNNYKKLWKFLKTFPLKRWETKSGFVFFVFKIFYFSSSSRKSFFIVDRFIYTSLSTVCRLEADKIPRVQRYRRGKEDSTPSAISIEDRIFSIFPGATGGRKLRVRERSCRRRDRKSISRRAESNFPATEKLEDWKKSDAREEKNHCFTMTDTGRMTWHGLLERYWVACFPRTLLADYNWPVL